MDAVVEIVGANRAAGNGMKERSRLEGFGENAGRTTAAPEIKMELRVDDGWGREMEELLGTWD